MTPEQLNELASRIDYPDTVIPTRPYAPRDAMDLKQAARELRHLAEVEHRLELVKEGLAAVLHIMDGNPQLILPMKSLVESMVKIVDE